MPVKPPQLAKSRLKPRPASLARTIGQRTIAAAARSGSVGAVVVVTADARWRPPRGSGARRIAERRPRSIATAIAAAEARLPRRLPRAVLLGDLPALDPRELGRLLSEASRHPRAFLRDADGTGTTLVTARAGVPLRTAFGSDSARRHAEAGLVELELPATSGLRRDVDTADQLDALRRR